MNVLDTITRKATNNQKKIKNKDERRRNYINMVYNCGYLHNNFHL